MSASIVTSSPLLPFFYFPFIRNIVVFFVGRLLSLPWSETLWVPKDSASYCMQNTLSRSLKETTWKSPPIKVSDSKPQNSCASLYPHSACGFFWSGDYEQKGISDRITIVSTAFWKRSEWEVHGSHWSIHNNGESPLDMLTRTLTHGTRKYSLSKSWFCPCSRCPVQYSPWLLVLTLGGPFLSIFPIGHIYISWGTGSPWGLRSSLDLLPGYRNTRIWVQSSWGWGGGNRTYFVQ